jgi:hypothetical protein
MVDIGLRLKDVQAGDLESENVYLRGRTYKFRSNLLRNGATEEEIKFLIDQSQRVELNAFASRPLVSWLEGKLQEHGIKKVLPDPQVLREAYRQSFVREYICKSIPALTEEAKRHLEASGTIPPDLRERVGAMLLEEKAEPWDRAIGRLARESARKL